MRKRGEGERNAVDRALLRERGAAALTAGSLREQIAKKEEALEKLRGHLREAEAVIDLFDAELAARGIDPEEEL